MLTRSSAARTGIANHSGGYAFQSLDQNPPIEIKPALWLEGLGASFCSGLFVTHTTIRKGTIITSYGGRLVTYPSSNVPNSEFSRGLFNSTNGRVAIEGFQTPVDGSGVGQFCNDPRGSGYVANAFMRTDELGGGSAIIANQDILPWHEIFVCYGRNYFKFRPSFDYRQRPSENLLVLMRMTGGMPRVLMVGRVLKQTDAGAWCVHWFGNDVVLSVTAPIKPGWRHSETGDIIFNHRHRRGYIPYITTRGVTRKDVLASSIDLDTDGCLQQDLQDFILDLRDKYV